MHPHCFTKYKGQNHNTKCPSCGEDWARDTSAKRLVPVGEAAALPDDLVRARQRRERAETEEEPEFEEDEEKEDAEKEEEDETAQTQTQRRQSAKSRAASTYASFCLLRSRADAYIDN
jgi:hypothetical protein